MPHQKLGNHLMNKQIGLYGGTFDPIHFGHLSLAIEMQEKRNLDEIWFCPAWINPLKVGEGRAASPEDRLAMVQLAVSSLPYARVIDVEMVNKTPSYTIDTLKNLGRLFPNHQFSLILGADAVQHFLQWKHPAEIIHLSRLLVGLRDHVDLSPLEINPLVWKSVQEGLTSTRVLDISAAEIRQRLKNNLYCRHLIPKEVLDYIYENDLYSSTRKT